MKRLSAVTVFLLAMGLSVPAHAGIKSWCRACICDSCGYSTTNGDYQYLSEAPPGSYPAGGDCGCAESHLTGCSSFGICQTYTPDPNAATDRPNPLNARCCTGAYDCGGYCKSYSSPTGTLSVPLTMWQPDNRPAYSAKLPPEQTIGPQTPDLRDVVRVDPAEHPWITSTTLVGDVSAISEDAGLVLASERKQLAAKVGWNVASRLLQNSAFVSPYGAHIHYQVQRNGPEWKFWFAREQKPAQQIWQVPAADRFTLTINGKTWKLEQGDLTLGAGTINP